MALALAITLLVSFLGLITLPILAPQYKPSGARIEAAKDIFMVLVGALAGYIGGRSDRD